MTEIIVGVVGCLVVIGGLIWGIWYENSPATKPTDEEKNEN